MPRTGSLEFEDVRQFAGDIDKVAAIASEEFDRAMTKALVVLKGQIIGRTPVNFGHLRQSIGSSQKVEMGEAVGIVSPGVPYAAAVEFGRKPGRMPPVDAIQMWVTRKLGLQDKEAGRAAFLIARAIGRRGTVGRYMFQLGMSAAEPHIMTIFDAATERILERLASE